MSRLAAFALGAAVTAVAAALFFSRAPVDGEGETERFRRRAYEAEARIAELRAELERLRDRAPRAPAAAAAPAVPEREQAPPVSTSPERVARPPMPEPSDPRLDPAWEPVLSGALRSEVQRRLGRELTPQQEERLLERLEAVRQAGLALDPEASDPAARLQQSLTRSVVLLEADRAFREELDIGLSDFLNDLNEGQLVDDLGAGAPDEVEEAEEAPGEVPDGAVEEVGAPVDPP